jgi:UBX domain
MDVDDGDGAGSEWTGCSPYDDLSWSEIRRLQDEEFAESLMKDVEMEEVRLHALKIEEEYRVRMGEIVRMRLNDLSSKQMRLGREPDAGEVRLAVRFPCGARSSRSFMGSDAVALIYDFAETQQPSCENFALIDNSRHVSLDDRGASLDSTGVRTRTTLLVVSAE